MTIRPWILTVAACALFSSSLLAGDYGHVLDVVKQTWPERTKGIALCSLEANQFALLDLVDTAKEKGISLAIINVKNVKESDRDIQTALQRSPDFLLIIDEDPLMGSKGALLKRLVARAMGSKVPAVGLSADALEAGAVLAAGADPTAKVFYNGKMLKKLEMPIPEGAEDKGPK